MRSISLEEMESTEFLDLMDGKYNGQLHKNEKIPHGEGYMMYTNGDTYRGSFRFGRRYGKGKLSLKNGVYYTGNFKKNLYDGFGKIIYSDGTNYEGGFKKGLKDGKGSFENRYGEIKDGLWQSNFFVA